MNIHLEANRLARLSFAITTLFASGLTSAGEILYSIESPVEGQSYLGVANLRGWAISPAGIDRVELYIDGEYKTDIPMGASRGDVGNAYPAYPGSATSGFSMAFNYSNLDPWVHHIRYEIYDNDGDKVTQDIPVVSMRIGESKYLGPTTAIDFSAATFATAGSEIQVTGMKVDGQAYDATLAWDEESQQFQFTNIE